MKTIQQLLLYFIRYFYQPDLPFIDKLIEQWLKSLIQQIVWVVFNGFIGYLTLSGLVFIFPGLDRLVFLGSKYWHIPIVIFYVGIIIWFFEALYKFIRKGYKHGGAK